VELKITITDEDEITVLEEIALANGLSMIDYATNIVSGWLKGQVKGRYLKHIQDKDPEEIKAILGKTYRELDADAKAINIIREIK